MTTRTLNTEGAVAPSACKSPVLRALLHEEAEALLARRYPELYFEPPLEAPEVGRDLTDDEEALRLQLFEAAAAEHEVRCRLWRNLRQRQIDLYVARLYRRYAQESLRAARALRRTELAAGVSRWLAVQASRGLFDRVEGRMVVYLLLQSARRSGAIAAGPEPWGAESFQSYLDAVTASYDGRNDEETEPARWVLRRAG